MDAQIILGIILVVIALVMLYFSAVGLVFMWIVKQARLMNEKDNNNHARKP